MTRHELNMAVKAININPELPKEEKERLVRNEKQKFYRTRRIEGKAANRAKAEKQKSKIIFSVSIPFTEQELEAAFTDETDRKILRVYFQDPFKSHSEIAAQVGEGVNLQLVTKLANSDMVKRFIHAKLNSDIGLGTTFGLRDQVANGNVQAMKLAIDAGLTGTKSAGCPECEKRKQPIDPLANKALKALGDFLAVQDHDLIFRSKLKPPQKVVEVNLDAVKTNS